MRRHHCLSVTFAPLSLTLVIAATIAIMASQFLLSVASFQLPSISTCSTFSTISKGPTRCLQWPRSQAASSRHARGQRLIVSSIPSIPSISSLPSVPSVSSVPSVPSRKPLFHSLNAAHDTNDVADDPFGNVESEEAEETLLRIHFSIPSNTPSAGEQGEQVLACIDEYARGFPFAAVLPVQPLTFMPIPPKEGAGSGVATSGGGVKLCFMRKKTPEKGSMDGGILFTYNLVDEVEIDDAGDIGDIGDEKDDGEDSQQTKIETNQPQIPQRQSQQNQQSQRRQQRIHLTAKRISKGQTVSKYFSEKQIIMAFVKGLSEARGEGIRMAGGQVESLFHLWM